MVILRTIRAIVTALPLDHGKRCAECITGGNTSFR